MLIGLVLITTVLQVPLGWGFGMILNAGFPSASLVRLALADAAIMLVLYIAMIVLTGFAVGTPGKEMENLGPILLAGLKLLILIAAKDVLISWLLLKYLVRR